MQRPQSESAVNFFERHFITYDSWIENIQGIIETYFQRHLIIIRRARNTHVRDSTFDFYNYIKNTHTHTHTMSTTPSEYR